VCFFSFLATVNASKFTLPIVHVSEEFGKSITEARYLICFNVLALGVENMFWVPIMRVVGKRLMFLLPLFILVAGNMWSLKTHDFNQLLAVSDLSGFTSSAGEAVFPAFVADLFFVHEQGTVMMIFHMALSSGFFLGPLIDPILLNTLPGGFLGNGLLLPLGQNGPLPSLLFTRQFITTEMFMRHSVLIHEKELSLIN
jgi:MFS family permease